ncbi:MAG: hypothetical protein Q7Q73_14560 [Verrucomicrobiota bacterium JB024]|nr:hypothetical protein [Verrucomicrobiota bacterium JB024]
MNNTILKTTLGKAALAAVAICGLAAAANATPVSFKFDSVSNSTTVKAKLNGQTKNLYVGTLDLTLYDSGSGNSAQTVAFCAEIGQSISIGSTYTNYNVTSLTEANIGLSESQARNAAILFDLYYQGQDASSWTTMESTAFQLALWELTHDDDGSMVSNGLSRGDFKVSIDDQNTGDYNTTRNYVNKAMDYLNQVEALAKNGYNPYSELVALTSTTNQDLVVLGVAIPGGGGGEPVAVPFGVNPMPGLAIIGLFGWRRLRKRMNARAEEAQAA